MTNNFGNNLMELRKKNGYSQEDLANKLNVTRQTISKWELEQTAPNLKELKKISDVFNVSLDELISNNVNTTSRTIVTTKKGKIKYLLIIAIILISVVLLYYMYRIYKIAYIKNIVDLACNSQNYYIEKTIYYEENFNQNTIESYKLYFLDGKIKILTIDNENLSQVNKIEILNDDVYYYIDVINKTYFCLPIEKYYELNYESDFPIFKDNVLNEIYYKFSISDNNELLKLIFNFEFKIKNEFNEYFSITNKENNLDSYILLQANIDSNKFEYINKIKKDEENNSAIQNYYFMELNCIENNDFEIPDLLEYEKIDI